ncbi:MAG: hypothetical protein ABIQ79_01460 [Nitrospiraceae bacterium]
MKRQTCPRCQRQSPHPHRSLLGCRVCSSAITQAALFIDPADAQVRNRRGPTDSQTGDNTTLEPVRH